MNRASPKLCLFLGRHASTSSGLWVYGRTVVEALLERDDAEFLPLEVAFAGPAECRQELEALLGRFQPGLAVLRELGKGFLGRRAGLFADTFSYIPRSPFVHGTANVVPLLGQAKKLLTLHDLLQAVPSLESRSFYNRVRAAYYDWYFRRAVSAAAAIITDAEGTALQIAARYGVSAAKISVIPCSLARAYTAAPLPDTDNDSRSFLAFASDDPRKNIPLLLRAARAFLADAQGLSLTIIANSPRLAAAIAAQAAEQRLAHKVRTVSGLSLEQLIALYAQSRALLFPSLAEGFGYPVFEALSQGIPALVHTGTICQSLVQTAPGWVVEAHCTAEEELVEGVRKLAAVEQTAAARAEVAEKVRTAFGLSPFGAALTAVYRKVV